MFEKDSIILGVIAGLVVPFIGYATWMLLFEQFTEWGIMSADGFSTNWRERTIALLAIAMNLIPFSYFNRKKHINTLRGIIFPTIAFAAAWMFFFGYKLVSGG